MTIQEQAWNIACDARNLFANGTRENSFTMYSFDKFSRLIICGMCEQMLSEGCTEDQIKEVLASKHVRWMLDGAEGQLIEIGYKLAQNYNMSREAKK